MSYPPGRVAVITGGNGTLARAIADCLQASGYCIHAPGRDELDVTNLESVESYFARLENVDLLVNNAGATEDGLSARMSPEQFAKVIDINLSGAMRCARAALKKMSSGGHIIQIGSRSAWDGKIGQCNYASAKAGLAAFTQSLAKEVGSLGIRVNYVAPGYLESKMTSGLSEQARQEILQRQCVSEPNTPAQVAAFLKCLNEMRGVSGQIFQLDSRIMAWS